MNVLRPNRYSSVRYSPVQSNPFEVLIIREFGEIEGRTRDDDGDWEILGNLENKR